MPENEFYLTLDEEIITVNLLHKLKNVFKSYPGESLVNLKIIGSSKSFKVLQLKQIKVNPSLSFLYDVISEL